MLFCCTLVKPNICCSFCELSRTSQEEQQHTLLAEPLVSSKHCTQEPWITKRISRLGLLLHCPLLSLANQAPLHSSVSGTRSLFLRMALPPCHEAAVALLFCSCSAQTFPTESMSLTSHGSAVLLYEATWQVCWQCFKVLNGGKLWFCMVPLLLSWTKVQAHAWIEGLAMLGHVSTTEENWDDDMLRAGPSLSMQNAASHAQTLNCIRSCGQFSVSILSTVSKTSFSCYKTLFHICKSMTVWPFGCQKTGK